MTWFSYWRVAPLADPLTDNGGNTLLEWSFDFEQKKISIALLGQNDRVEMIRATIPGDGKLSQPEIKVINELKELILSLLRIMHDSSIEQWRHEEDTVNFGSFGDSEGKPNFSVTLSLTGGKGPLPLQGIGQIFSATQEHKPFIRLLDDGMQPRLPAQYRFLSLYKLLELELKVKGKWVGLSDFISPFEEEFRLLGVSKRPLSKFLHEFRDRCAHIKLGGKDELGVTGLSPSDSETFRKMKPLMLKMAITILKDRHGLPLQFVPSVETADDSSKMSSQT